MMCPRCSTAGQVPCELPARDTLTCTWDRDVPVTQPSEVHPLVTSEWKLSIGLAPVPEMLFWLGFLACFLSGTGFLVVCGVFLFLIF